MTTPQSAAIVTTPPGSGLGTPANTSFDEIKADIAQLYNNPGAVFFNGNLTYSVGTLPAQESFVYMPLTTLSGTVGAWPFGANPSVFMFQNNSDLVDTTTSGTGYLVNVYMRDVPATGHTGARATLWSEINITGSPAIAAGQPGYVAGQFQTRVNANLGGGSTATATGNVFGIDSNVFTGASATFLSFITGMEVACSINTGSSANNRFGIDIAAGGTVRGTWDDAALSIRGSATATWQYGIEFGGSASSWSMGTDSTLVGATARSHGGSSSPVALYGVDWSNVVFQSGGAAFKSNGFEVDPTGQVVAQVATVATLPTGIKGGRAFVTDATQTMAAGIGTIVAGTGGNNVPVYFDGSNWRIG